MDANAKNIVNTLWPVLSRKPRLASGEGTKSLNFEAYCEYYKRQFIQVVPPAGTPDVTAFAQSNLTDVIRLLQSNPDHDTALALVRSKTPVPSDKACENLLNLAARLLLMLRFGNTGHHAFPRGHLSWNNGSLRHSVQVYFAAPPQLDYANVRLPKLFNAWSIAAVAGIELVFTDNLADHLRLVDDSTLCIFHHASFLELQQNSMFPDGFIDETLCTLALLFPQADFSTAQRRTIMAGSKQKWFQALRHEHKDLVLDPRLVLCGNLKAENRQIDCFYFWRDRLIILKQAFDEATPRTFSQWWHDGRDGVQWSTFWVAILVLIITTSLGVIQCIEGALQVYKSFA
ncbi:hypothetical protein BJ166DRAFT_536558 [Pestalotiopsis sp. NC0098]|nr:hypothetical protein BJ166DRAFT_536558 [Pestalotiopsis sp. NC0098]